MFRRFLGGVAAAAVLLTAGAGLAQDISAGRLSDHIRVLADDSFQGRVPGQIGETLTLAYLQAQYEAMGLEPGGPDGQWLQPVTLFRFTPARAAVAHWTAPDGTQYPLAAIDIQLRSANDSGEVRIADAPVVFAGYGITAPERGWDDYGSLDVTGKVVIVLAGEPAGDLFRGDYTTLYSSAGYKKMEALRRGAVGVITLVLDEAAWQGMAGRPARTRTTVKGLDPIPFTGTVGPQTAMQWGSAAGIDHGAMATVDTGRFRAIELTGVRLTVDIEESREEIQTYNLLAKIEGSENPDEVVIFSAHWDHVGVGSPDAHGDTIFNGAWDNASGTAGILELARAFSLSPQPQRTVVFAHMAAEEMGLLGAWAYSVDPVYPLETTVADLNIDMLPLSGPTRDVAIFGFGQNTLEDDLAVLAEAEGRYVTDDREPEQNYYFRSDHFPFARAGVPALMPWHGVDLDEGGIEVGLPEYQALFSRDYHQRSDEWRADYDLRSAVENLTLMYQLAWDLANSDRWPTWKADSEFGAIRARSDAARQ